MVGINRFTDLELGLRDTHAAVNIKFNKDLLCSTENYAEYLVITYNRKESEKEDTCVCVFSGLIYVDIIILLRRIDQNLEKTLESALDCKENKPVNPKRNQP